MIHEPRIPIAERLAAEAPLAIGSVLHRAHDRARALRQTLELEAADPRVAVLHQRARDLQRDIAGLLVEVASDGVELNARRRHPCPRCGTYGLFPLRVCGRCGAITDREVPPSD